ncbi:MAG: hypothetical protein E7085_04465 [Parabacteroides distasonis]|nr:hypothetical protein [Parabacteroides distasonis]
MRRVASHYLYWKELYRMHYVELDDAGSLVGVFPLEGEQAGTEFYDGIILPVFSGEGKTFGQRVEIPWASGHENLSIALLADALSDLDIPGWAEVGKPTELLLLSVPLAAAKLGADNSCRNGYIKRL